MNLRRTSYFALAITLALTLTGLTARAEQPEPTSQTLNLSEAQVFQIHALLAEQTAEIQTLNINVQNAQQTLSQAVSKGDAVLTANAVLSLDAAQKALRITQEANKRDLLALLNDSQKQTVKEFSTKSARTSD